MENNLPNIMTGSPKGLDATGKHFLLILVFLILTNLAIFLDIPFLRQLLGIVFLTVIPGLLILLLLKLNKLALAEKIVLTVGLSIAFLMLFGWLLNQASLMVGYMSPLSTNFLMIALSLALTALLIAAYVGNKEAFSSTTFRIELNTRGKLCLLLPAIFPLLSILGMYFLNTSNNNAILLALLFLIPVSVTLITSQRREIPENTYPIAIAMISAALLSMFYLRSEHILGADVHVEYYFSQMTLLNQHWKILEYSLLDSSLSISLLPAIYQSLLHTNGGEYLFKGVFTLIGTFSPLSIYVIAKKYLGDRYAFLAALFFISQISFLVTPGSPRTNLAIFFFALSIMVLFHNGITGVNRKGLFITFMGATIVSHYATTYIFFFLMLLTWLLGLILRKYALWRNVTLISIYLFFALIFFWYGQLTQTPFTQGVTFVEETIGNLSRFFVEEAREAEVNLILGKGIIGEKAILSQIYFVITWLTFAFIGAGIVGMLIKRRQTISTHQWGSSPPGFLQSRFETEYSLLALVCCGMLVAIVVIPYVSTEYGILRMYSQIAVISSGLFVLGGIILSKYLRASSSLLILLVLIPYFLFQTGAIHEVSGIHANIVLSSEAPASDFELVYHQERLSAQWLKEHAEENPRIYVTDNSGWYKLISQGKISSRLINAEAFRKHHPIKGYIYLTHNNVVNGKLLVSDELRDISDYSDVLMGKSKLYANGGSEIYK